MEHQVDLQDTSNTDEYAANENQQEYNASTTFDIDQIKAENEIELETRDDNVQLESSCINESNAEILQVYPLMDDEKNVNNSKSDDDGDKINRNNSKNETETLCITKRNTNNDDNTQPQVLLLNKNPIESKQLIGEIIKIEKLDNINYLKSYISNNLNYNRFLRDCMLQKPVKKSKRKLNTVRTYRHLYNDDFEWECNIGETVNTSSPSLLQRPPSRIPLAAADKNNQTQATETISQKKSLRIKSKNSLFKKLIEREKQNEYFDDDDNDFDDYLDDDYDDVDGDYEANNNDYAFEENMHDSHLNNTNNSELNAIDLNESVSYSELDESKPRKKSKKSLNARKKGYINSIVNGKDVYIDQNDYKNYVRYGKWCSLEFFRVINARKWL